MCKNASGNNKNYNKFCEKGTTRSTCMNNVLAKKQILKVFIKNRKAEIANFIFILYSFLKQ